MKTEVKVLRCAADLIEKLDVDLDAAYSIIASYGDKYVNACVKYLSGKDYSDIPFYPSLDSKRKMHAIVSSYFRSDDWSWVEDWRQQFPAGIRTFGRLVRGDKRNVLKKMRKFFTEFPEYADAELVNKATNKYLYEKQKENWEATTCADYFIFKNDASMLASYCELVDSTDFTQEVQESDDDSTL